jgi:NAD(P)-dependent dehydrogenase (short-subunit alcohol dehydrogenase family)
LSEAVLKQGDRLVATARNVSALADLASLATGGDQLITVKLDVTKQEDVDEAFAQAVEHFGRVDFVVNNAGYGLMGEFESISDEQIRAQLDVNLWGVLRVSRAAVKVFREVNNKSVPKSGGHLIQISSVGGFTTAPCLSIYQARCPTFISQCISWN